MTRVKWCTIRVVRGFVVNKIKVNPDVDGVCEGGEGGEKTGK